jgi:hypothetical protein
VYVYPGVRTKDRVPTVVLGVGGCFFLFLFLMESLILTTWHYLFFSSLYFGSPLIFVFILLDMFLGEGCVIWASWDGLILSFFLFDYCVFLA